jgi:hypothetical protein
MRNLVNNTELQVVGCGRWAAARGMCALWVVSHPDLPLLVISTIWRDLSSLQPTPHLHPNSTLNPKTRLDVGAAKRKQQTALISFRVNSCQFVGKTLLFIPILIQLLIQKPAVVFIGAARENQLPISLSRKFV